MKGDGGRAGKARFRAACRRHHQRPVELPQRERTHRLVDCSEQIVRAGKSAAGRHDSGPGQVDADRERPRDEIEIDADGAGRRNLARSPRL